MARGRHRENREPDENEAAWQEYRAAKAELVPPDSEDIAPMAVWDKFLTWWKEVT